MKAPQETDEAIGSKCRLIKSWLCGVVMSQVPWSCKAMVVQPRVPDFFAQLLHRVEPAAPELTQLLQSLEPEPAAPEFPQLLQSLEPL